MRRWLRRGLQSMTFVFKRCRNVLIEDVTLVGSTLWNVRLWGCDGVVVRGVTIESDLEKAANSDGIDIDGSRNVRISDSRIATADDAIVLKSGKWLWDGQGESFPTENVVVTNCVLSSSSSAFTIGTESYEDFRHIVLSDSVIRDSNRAFGINIQDGATVEDVRIAGVTVELRRRHWNWWGSGELLHFVVKRRTPGSRLGAVRRIVIESVTARAQGTSHIVGPVERPLEGVTLSGIRILMTPEATPDKRATHGLVAEGVTGLRLRDVELVWDDRVPEPRWQSALVVKNARDFELSGFVGQAAPGSSRRARGRAGGRRRRARPRLSRDARALPVRRRRKPDDPPGRQRPLGRRDPGQLRERRAARRRDARDLADHFAAGTVRPLRSRNGWTSGSPPVKFR